MLSQLAASRRGHGSNPGGEPVSDDVGVDIGIVGRCPQHLLAVPPFPSFTLPVLFLRLWRHVTPARL